jgi:hypothetical protein
MRQVLCHNGDTLESRSSREAIAGLAVHPQFKTDTQPQQDKMEQDAKRAASLPAAALPMLPAVTGKRSGPSPTTILPLPLH